MRFSRRSSNTFKNGLAEQNSFVFKTALARRSEDLFKSATMTPAVNYEIN
jgi:hypothetical protein